MTTTVYYRARAEYQQKMDELQPLLIPQPAPALRQIQERISKYNGLVDKPFRCTNRETMPVD